MSLNNIFASSNANGLIDLTLGESLATITAVYEKLPSIALVAQYVENVLENGDLVLNGENITPAWTNIVDNFSDFQEQVSLIAQKQETYPNLLERITSLETALMAAEGGYVTLNAQEALSYSVGIAETSPGQSFYVYDASTKQVKRYMNGVSVSAQDFLMVYPTEPVLVDLPSVKPNGAWDGSAGSGFSATPVDPVRATAKPVVRLLTPDYQSVVGKRLVGVFAAASKNRSLYNNLGLSGVRFHFEGGVVEVSAPSYQTITDANGNQKTHLGWWAELENPDTVEGLGHLYVEAIPADNSMQSRVMGPFTFNCRDQEFDYEIEVAPSLSEIVGVRYKTFAAVHAWMSANNGLFTYPRITVTEPGNYAMAPAISGDPGCANSWITIRATAPIAFTTGDGAQGFWLRTNNYRFVGDNITIDFSDVRLMRRNTNAPYNLRNYWFDGINLTIAYGRDNLVNGTYVTPTIAGENWYTDCILSNGCHAILANLVRGCTLNNNYGDLLTNAKCVIDNQTNGYDSAFYNAEIPALEISYSGAEATATAELSGVNNKDNRVLGLRYGSSSANFTIRTNDPLGGSYTIQDVADWVNTIPGFSATVLDGTRRAAALTKSGAWAASAFAATDVKAASLTMITKFDLHADWYQFQNNLDGGNTVIWGNTGKGLIDVQVLFLQPAASGLKDVLIANNSFHHNAGSNWSSQITQPMSHVVIAHNTLVNQNFILSTTNNLSFDAYSFISANSLTTLNWSGAALQNPPVNDNLLDGGANLPANTTGNVAAGTAASKFVNAAEGNFSPQNEMLENLKTSVVGRDQSGELRGLTAAVGALA